jgi:hypothetical protein
MRPREGPRGSIRPKAALTTCAAAFKLYLRLSASFSLRLESLERHDPKEAVRWRAGTFERHVLRRDAVNAQYLAQSAPGDPFPSAMIFICCPGRTKTPETTGL